MAGLEMTQEELKDIERKQLIVSKLNNSGALDIRGGSVQLHFDADGNLRRIDRMDTLLRS